MKPTFSTLIFLTILTVVLFLPFVFSPVYLSILRESNFDFHSFLKGELYKQITGYLSLIFVLTEMALTARKHGKTWKMKINLAGSMQLWRKLHIFLGIALLGTTLIHTFGAQGLNFNAIFLWVFFAVTLSALMGTLAEVGILESSYKHFNIPLLAGNNSVEQTSGMSKGVLIRKLRLIWLNTHIFLVSIFLVMLLVHIFIAYYYQ
ncbi:MAG: hypothetical protein AB4041_07055 [Microcystaceae cyanobacterium]